MSGTTVGLMTDVQQKVGAYFFRSPWASTATEGVGESKCPRGMSGTTVEGWQSVDLNAEGGFFGTPQRASPTKGLFILWWELSFL